MFNLSPTAAAQIQKAARDSGAEDLVLRVAARRLTDGSIDYGMGFDETGEGDMHLQLADVSVVIAPHHAELLEETLLDFVEMEPGQFNFIFVNQQSAFTSGGGCSTGGCGTSGCGSGGCASTSQH